MLIDFRTKKKKEKKKKERREKRKERKKKTLSSSCPAGRRAGVKRAGYLVGSKYIHSRPSIHGVFAEANWRSRRRNRTNFKARFRAPLLAAPEFASTRLGWAKNNLSSIRRVRAAC